MLVLKTWNLSGELNMALDAILAEIPEEPILRIYTWSEPTLSLGRHQKRINLNIDYMKKTR